MNRRVLLIIGVVLTAIGGLVICALGWKRQFEASIPRPSSREIAVSAVIETRLRIEEALQRGVTPASLRELPWRRGYENRTADGWGRQVIFELTKSGRSTLIRVVSAGPDGVFSTNDDIVEEAAFDSSADATQ